MIAHGDAAIEHDPTVTAIIVVIAIAVVVIGGVAMLGLALRGVERRARATVQADIDALAGTPGLVLGPARADCHGDVGLDLPAGPGVGTLLLTAEALLFRPRGGGVADDMVLPIARVTGAERARAYQRYPTDPRVSGPQLLVIEAEGLRGPGRIAWTVSDAAGWATAVTAAASAVRA